MSKRGRVQAEVGPQLTGPKAADIDRLGVLRVRIAENVLRMAADVAAEAALEEKLLALYAEAPGDAVAIAEGAEFVLQVGQRAKEKQQLDLEARALVQRWLGKDAALAIWRPTFEVLKAALTADQFKQVVIEKRTGRRTLKVAAKAA